MLITASQGTARVINEIPSGLINGINTTFTTANVFVAGSEIVLFNGVRQLEGALSDYIRTESTSGNGFDTITVAVAPRPRPGAKPNDQVRIDYDLA